MREICRYHAATSGSVARQATVHRRLALGGGVAPLDVARSCGSNIRACPAESVNATVPVPTVVAPAGSDGCAGIGGSEVPGGSVGALEAEGRTDVAGDGVLAEVALASDVGVDDGRALVAAADAVAFGAAVVGAAAHAEIAITPAASDASWRVNTERINKIVALLQRRSTVCTCAEVHARPRRWPQSSLARPR